MRSLIITLVGVAILLLSPIIIQGGTIVYATSSSSSSSSSSSITTISFPLGSGGSWNPKVNCKPQVVTISDITDNLVGMASYDHSIFSPGITSSTGQVKRWLTNATGDTLPHGWQPPGPPCSITNSKGQVISSFVEIDGVALSGLLNDQDCSTKYDPLNGGSALPNGATYCTYTFNAYNSSVISPSNYAKACLSATDPVCAARIHIAIDLDWLAAGYCGVGTACNNVTIGSYKYGTLFDIQGFVYWNPLFLNESWHSFSGWELHPLTAWKLDTSSGAASNNGNLQASAVPGQQNHGASLLTYGVVGAIVAVLAVAGTFLLVRKRNAKVVYDKATY